MLARDEWAEDTDFVIKAKAATFIKNREASHCRRFLLDHNGEEIQVTRSEFLFHDFQHWPMKMAFNPFIPGRPNPIRIPIVPLNFEQSPHYVAGAEFNWRVKQIDLWTYVEDYPPQIEVDCRNLSLYYSI